ncbi:MAG: rod shape-determining protein MreC [Rickettsiales bacterium]|jgi:rod shape-determining protein MreC|nr:rod shape-determining protein MreC [Rickettsiales bacterium]
MGAFSKPKSNKHVFKRLAKRMLSLTFVGFALMLVFVFGSDHKAAIRVEGAVLDAVSPLAEAVTWPFRRAADFVSSVGRFRVVDRINVGLQERILELEQEISLMRMALAEADTAAGECSFVRSRPAVAAVARVAGQGGGGLTRSYILAAGKAGGVEKYQAVMSGDALVGQIVAVGSDYSRMMLLTDAASRVSVANKRTGTRAFLVGNNSMYPRLLHLETQDVFEPGDVLVTTGLDGNIPPEIPVGMIGAYSSEGGITVQPFADEDRLWFVRILSNPDAAGIRSFLHAEAAR